MQSFVRFGRRPIADEGAILGGGATCWKQTPVELAYDKRGDQQPGQNWRGSLHNSREPNGGKTRESAEVDIGASISSAQSTKGSSVVIHLFNLARGAFEHQA
jgi:hypothetical protein